jgi:hypothetical protein
VPSVLLLVIGGISLWIAMSVLAVALCRVAAHGDRTVIDPVEWTAEFAVILVADRRPRMQRQ